MPLIRTARRLFTRRRRFASKLFISFLLMCTVPTLLITNLFYLKAKEQITEASTEFIQMLTVQLAASVNNYVEQINNNSLAVYSDYDLVSYLGNEASYISSDQIRYNLLVSRQLSTFMTQLPHLQGAAMISSSGKIYNNGYFPDMADNRASWERWLETVRTANGKLVIIPTHSHVYHSTGAAAGVFSAGRLIQDIEGRQAGILLFQLSLHRLIADSDTLNPSSMPYHRRIVISSKEQLLFDSDIEAAAFIPESEPQTIDPGRWLFRTDPSGPLSVTVAVSRKDLGMKITLYRNLALGVATATVLAIALLSLLLSYQIVKPMIRLIRSMRRVEDGWYQPISEKGLNIELEALIQSYNLMIIKVKHLIEDVYLARIKQNQAKLLALQNQINPHWLFNTLESIRMQAHISKAPDVAHMIKNLGRLFQMALARREEHHQVSNEIEYIRVYMQLQNVRFEDRFRLTVTLPEVVMKAPILSLTFQPIVENCIVHSFLDPDRQYEIRIDGEEKDGTVLVHIADNGAGIKKERLEEIRRTLDNPDWSGEGAAAEGSLGLRNIHERLQLHYGKQYGISLESVPDEGTTVAIHFPVRKGEDHVEGPAGG
ncbi:MAG: putative sensor with domain [Paenibacillaceae bacterium]|jgi:two-component system sensor histidine kinase YesM|nr:putative sensor with domain [Paenibacillaceae bacterium]